jgi:uncharacterized membrane protein
MVSLSSALGVAALSGLYSSAWGSYKDSPYEGFKPATFPRSPLISAFICALLWFTPRIGAGLRELSLVQIFFVVMGMERIFTEIYKGCFRHEDQSKYVIPQQVAVFGRAVQSEFWRLASGMVGILLMAGVLLVPHSVESLPGFFGVCVLTGSFTCLGGAYKDAPFEGFILRKFFRSVVVLLPVAPLLYLLGPMPFGFLIYMAGGVERMLVEYYKTFARPRAGKFRPELLEKTPPVGPRALMPHLARLIMALALALYAHHLYLRYRSG